jgi:hypothetical protein
LQLLPCNEQIQEEWRKIGHVPRKYSDKIWLNLKRLVMHILIKEHKSEDNAEEVLL